MGIHKESKKINYSNRGMELEHDINETNQYYLNNNRNKRYNGDCSYRKPSKRGPQPC